VLEQSAPGATIEVMARASLLEASRGFARLSPDELVALGALFGRAYDALAPTERARLEAYLADLRSGRVSEAATERAARQAFNQAIGALAPDERAQLQALYARAIALSLEARQQARLAPLQVVPAAVTPPTVPRAPAAVQYADRAAEATPEARVEAPVDTDAIGREQASGYRNAIKAAEERVAAADAKLKWAEEHWHFVNSHTNDSYPLNEARQTLETARKNHAAAKDALDAAEERARRAGIPPGWLR
jgi:hypothetical protein